MRIERLKRLKVKTVESAARWKDYPKFMGVGDKFSKRFYNYLKSKNIKHTFYHGTSIKIFEEITRSGYLVSPVVRKMEKYEVRQKGLDQVFFTTSPIYASYYADRAASQTKSDPLILIIDIPLYMLTEVNQVILDPTSWQHIYNESNIPNKIKSIIEQNKGTGEEEFIVFDRIIETIGKQITEKDLWIDDEYTTRYMVPAKYIKGKVRDIGRSILGEAKAVLDSVYYSNPSKQIEFSAYDIPKLSCILVPEKREEIFKALAKYPDPNSRRVAQTLLGIQEQSEGVDFWRSFLKTTNSVEDDVRIYSFTPKNIAEVLKPDVKKSIIEHLKRSDKTSFYGLDLFFKDDPDILGVLKNNFIKKCNSYIGQPDYYPVPFGIYNDLYQTLSLQQDPEIMQIYKNVIITAFKNGDSRTSQIPPFLQNDPDIKTAMDEFILRQIKDSIASYSSLLTPYKIPDKFDDPKYIPIIKEAWLEKLRNTGHYYVSLPVEWRDDIQFKEAAKEGIRGYLKRWADSFMTKPSFSDFFASIRSNGVFEKLIEEDEDIRLGILNLVKEKLKDKAKTGTLYDIGDIPAHYYQIPEIQNLLFSALKASAILFPFKDSTFGTYLSSEQQKELKIIRQNEMAKKIEKNPFEIEQVAWEEQNENIKAAYYRGVVKILMQSPLEVFKTSLSTIKSNEFKEVENIIIPKVISMDWDLDIFNSCPCYQQLMDLYPALKNEVKRRILIYVGSTYNRLPPAYVLKPFNKDAEILARLETVIKKHPDLIRDLTLEVRESNEFLKETYIDMESEEVRYDPGKYRYLSETYQKEPKIQKAFVDSFDKVNNGLPIPLSNSNPMLNNPEFMAKQKEAIKKATVSYGLYWFLNPFFCPSYYQNQPDVLDTAITCFKQTIERGGFYTFENCLSLPRGMLQHPFVKQYIKTKYGYMDGYKKLYPEDFKKDEENKGVQEIQQEKDSKNNNWYKYAQNYTVELAQTTKDPKILADILRRGNNDNVSYYAASNPSTPPDALAEVLRRGKNDWVSQNVALNPSTPPDVLTEVLRRGNNDWVSQNASENPSSSPFDVYKWYEATGKITKFDPTKHILDKPKEEPKEDPDLKRLEELALEKNSKT